MSGATMAVVLSGVGVLGLILTGVCAVLIGVRSKANGGPGFRVFAGDRIPDIPQRRLLLAGCLAGVAILICVGALLPMSVRPPPAT